MANNKVQLSNGTVVIDLSSDTVTSASHIKSGLVGHLADGTTVTGTLVEKDVKIVTYNLTGGATASVTPSEVVAGQGFSVKLTAPTGYNLNNVTVTMGGVDITSQVFTPDEAGGGAPSATQHTIYFEFNDSTNTTITAYWDDSFISDAITATTPTTYGSKTVTLAQLDGVTWYEPAPIPLNTQLIDFTAVKRGYIIDGNTGEESEQAVGYCSDYTAIDPTMTFTYIGYQWWDAAFYDSSKAYISGFMQYDYADTTTNDFAHGTLTPARIPSNAAYIRLTSYPSDFVSSEYMSLIRTA